jgi:hypothetical protein
VEPIPESRQAADDLDPTIEADPLARLLAAAEQVRVLVPDCVGISLGSSEHGVTFTVVASNSEVATLDSVQYLAGGPCVDAVEAGRVIEFDHETLLDEARWQLFAQATAASGVVSTLTLPIIGNARVTGSVNLYASTHRAFEGHHEAIARIFGAWAPGAVANADLAFNTRVTAARAPRVLREQLRIDVATGLLAARLGVEAEEARELIRAAALRAGVSELQLAEAVIGARGTQGSA